MTKSYYMRGRKILLPVGILIALLGLGIAIVAAPAMASDPPTQPFDLVFTATDEQINVVQLSRGTHDADGGTATRVGGIPGTDIRKAYLIWAGLGRDDDGVMFQRDAETAALITPGYIWNNDNSPGNTWDCCGGELSNYAADITDMGIVQNGDHSYTISDMEMSVENWGFSLLVVYEDPAITTLNDVIIKLGNDGLHYRWQGLVGPNSDVQCTAFPSAEFTRTAQFGIVAGGIEDDFRPNGLWGMADNLAYVDPSAEGGTWTQAQGLIDLPANGGYPAIVGIGGATEIDGPLDGDKTGNGVDWPFSDNQGDQWDLYPIFDVPVTPGETWACLQIESSSRAELPPAPQPGFPNSNIGASIGFVGLVTIIESDIQPEPSIVIEKATNSEDADTPTGPAVLVGDPITWTYVVTNTGTVTLTNVTVTDDIIGAVTCPVDILGPAESMTCTDTGIAVEGQYANMGSVEGTPPTGENVTDMDPSHYFATVPAAPAIDIEKATNGEDADNPTGPTLEVGDPITWTYVVTNIGTVTLTNVTVTDDIIGAITCPADVLAPGGSMTCTETGIAVEGQYANEGTVVGTPPTGANVTDMDPSHYFATVPPVPNIDIEKATNGEDADTAPGPQIDKDAPVIWTYVVTNIGETVLNDVSVTDDIEGAIDCPKTTLAVGEAMTCEKSGIGTMNNTTEQYANVSSVIGTSPAGMDVTDTDPSHYTGPSELGIIDPDIGAPDAGSFWMFLPISIGQ